MSEQPAPAPSCGDCRFWNERTHLRTHPESPADIGACRRFPPTAAGMRGGQHSNTHRDTWCGEHRGAEADPAEHAGAEPGAAEPGA